MTTILPLNDWFEIATHGTSGDQVYDILYSWKAQLDEWEQGFIAKECEWEWQDEEESYYVTKCGKTFYFVDGDTLSENISFKYCPYCGKSIKHNDQYDPSYDGLIPDEEE